MSAAPAAAVPVAERVPTLDVIRGIALLGILVMNMPGYAGSFFAEADGSHQWPGRLDQLAEQVRDLLFSGKFNSMLSLLFGLGFTIQYERLWQADPRRATRRYLRRLLALGAVGLVHATVFWTNRLATMIFLILTIVRLMQRPDWARRLAPLAAPGRMPLTVYLAQTALCTAIFYGWGLGLYGRVGPAAGLLLSLVPFFGVQLPASRWWLRRHERGPLEQAWGRLTYG